MKLLEILEMMLDRRLLSLSVLLLLALCLRAARPFVVDRISKDGVLYVYMARDIASGDVDSAFLRNRRMPPLYVFMMAWLSRSGFSAEVAGLVVSVLAGALLVVPVFLIGELMHGRRLAALAAFLVGVNPDLVRISGTVMRDPLFLLMLFCSLYCLLKAMSSEGWEGTSYWLLCGGFAALGTAVRTEGILILPVGVLCVVVEVAMLVKDKSAGLNSRKVLATFSGLCIMFVGCYLVSFPLLKALEGSPGTWSLVDRRMFGYLQTFSADSASGRD